MCNYWSISLLSMPCIRARIIDKNNLMMVKKFSSNLIDDDLPDTLHLIGVEKNRMDWKGHSCQAAEQLLDMKRIESCVCAWSSLRGNPEERAWKSVNTMTTTKLKKTLHYSNPTNNEDWTLRILKCINKSVTRMILKHR